MRLIVVNRGALTLLVDTPEKHLQGDLSFFSCVLKQWTRIWRVIKIKCLYEMHWPKSGESRTQCPLTSFQSLGCHEGGVWDSSERIFLVHVAFFFLQLLTRHTSDCSWFQERHLKKKINFGLMVLTTMKIQHLKTILNIIFFFEPRWGIMTEMV